MSIQYVLHKSKLVNVPEGYLARVKTQGSVDLEGVGATLRGWRRVPN